jgi:hypothetical protein
MKRTLLLAAVIAVLAAPAASAKEGAQAHLLAPLPPHPSADSLTLRWSVDVPGTPGTRRPFGAIGMFVRLLGREGASTRATAPQYEPPYHVRIRVPAGGIRSIRFGLMGTSCGPSGCKPSPMFFPLR